MGNPYFNSSITYPNIKGITVKKNLVYNLEKIGDKNLKGIN